MSARTRRRQQTGVSAPCCPLSGDAKGGGSVDAYCLRKKESPAIPPHVQGRDAGRYEMSHTHDAPPSAGVVMMPGGPQRAHLAIEIAVFSDAASARLTLPLGELMTLS
jgi:hypothetical protein